MVQVQRCHIDGCHNLAVDTFRDIPLCGECIDALASMNSDNEAALQALLERHFRTCVCGSRAARTALFCAHCGWVFAANVVYAVAPGNLSQRWWSDNQEEEEEREDVDL